MKFLNTKLLSPNDLKRDSYMNTIEFEWEIFHRVMTNTSQNPSLIIFRVSIHYNPSHILLSHAIYAVLNDTLLYTLKW